MKLTGISEAFKSECSAGFREVSNASSVLHFTLVVAVFSFFCTLTYLHSVTVISLHIKTSYKPEVFFFSNKKRVPLYQLLPSRELCTAQLVTFNYISSAWSYIFICSNISFLVVQPHVQVRCCVK